MPWKPIGGKGLKVVTYRCKIPVHKSTLEDFNGIQAIDSENLYGPDHLYFAISKAKKAEETGECISNDLFVEVVLRASGQRQIKKALEIFGLKGSMEIAVFGENIPDEIEGRLGAAEMTIEVDPARLERLKETFSISETEITAVSDSPEEVVKDIIRERIALTSLR